MENNTSSSAAAMKYAGGFDSSPSGYAGTSIFDPVLCELIYRWFSFPKAVILDPFAGGSVRGIIASKLGRQYVGVELREEQVIANREQGDLICADVESMPVWEQGDSANIDTLCSNLDADLIFSCPPYADLEVYSDKPEDISNMNYPDFAEAYCRIIAKSCSLLKQDRFACFVVGDIRDPAGNYRNFPGLTIKAFAAAGLSFYNEAILITVAGTLPIRVGKQFTASRKLGKCHQNVLIFVKGDPKKASEACGAVDLSGLEQVDEEILTPL